MSPKIRVLVCDDSVVIRRLVADVLAGDPDIEVVGTAVNGKNCIDKLPGLKPDIVTLDVEMPVMDGLETLVEIRKTDRRLPIIMFSTLTERGASATLDALERGASDYVTKPANVGSISESMEAVRSQLIPKIKSLTGRVTPVVRRLARPAFGPPPGGQSGHAGQSGQSGHGAPGAPGAPGATRPGRIGAGDARISGGGTQRPEIVCIGVSTGGPDALTHVITRLPADFPLPIVITQHMPPVFTQLFAQRLDSKSKLTVHEATHNESVRPGKVLIAPGDFHMRVVNRGSGPQVTLDQGPQENYCRPAVDPMFRSVAEVYGGRALAVIMTGMGGDGARGAEPLIRAGGSLIVQDEATSVVWGMPGAAVAAGLPCDVVPLEKIADALIARANAARGVLAAGPISGRL